jgi:hypothetical protein
LLSVELFSNDSGHLLTPDIDGVDWFERLGIAWSGCIVPYNVWEDQDTWSVPIDVISILRSGHEFQLLALEEEFENELEDILHAG